MDDLLSYLRYGSVPWNHWRMEHPEAPIVLDGAALDGQILTGIDFSGARLRGASLHATNLMNADLRDADLSGANLVEADLIGANLQRADLRGARLREADLLGADLAGARYALRDLDGALHGPIEIRPAAAGDAAAMAAAHLDSIRAIGPAFYPEVVVESWIGQIEPGMYLAAMAAGEQFFVAVHRYRQVSEVWGFSSHRVDEGVHGVAVYVRGHAARRGFGSALLRSAEAAARASGAGSLHLESSLAAVDFYRAHGFQETGHGTHRLGAGGSMACVLMRKNLREIAIQ
jgi:ribosomal protein S18 acetylase RimI-like enzyme